MKISVEKSVWSVRSVVNLFKTRRFLMCFGREKVNAVALAPRLYQLFPPGGSWLPCKEKSWKRSRVHCTGERKKGMVIREVSMGSTQTVEPGSFFEQFMAGMQELRKNQEKTEKLIEKNAREMEALKRTVERVTANVGGLNRSLGELIETLIAARLWEKFPGYRLKRAYQRMPIFDEMNRVMTDIDILLSNTILAVAVEVKRELDRMKDVDEHLKRMELIRKYPPAEVADKKLLGAMAGGVVDPDVQRYACENGFFVLELAGESVRLVPPPEGFVPREW
jgi:hypothetical protein